MHGCDHNSGEIHSLPGENMAGARPAMASCLFLAKSEILQIKTPSKVVADISLSRPSISATVRSFSPTVRSSCRTWKSSTPVRHDPPRLGFKEETTNILFGYILKRRSLRQRIALKHLLAFSWVFSFYLQAGCRFYQSKPCFDNNTEICAHRCPL